MTVRFVYTLSLQVLLPVEGMSVILVDMFDTTRLADTTRQLQYYDIIKTSSRLTTLSKGQITDAHRDMV